MLRVEEYSLTNELGKCLRLFIGELRGVAHQHQPMRLERLSKRWVYVAMGIGLKPQSLVEVLSANGNLLLGRVNFEHDTV